MIPFEILPHVDQSYLYAEFPRTKKNPVIAPYYFLSAKLVAVNFVFNKLKTPVKFNE